MLGFATLNDPEVLKRALERSPTKWLFTWGLGEVGVYKIEVEERCTAIEIEPLENVVVVIHDQGHRFPIPEIKAFFERHLSPASTD